MQFSPPPTSEHPVAAVSAIQTPRTEAAAFERGLRYCLSLFDKSEGRGFYTDGVDLALLKDGIPVPRFSSAFQEAARLSSLVGFQEVDRDAVPELLVKMSSDKPDDIFFRVNRDDVSGPYVVLDLKWPRCGVISVNSTDIHSILISSVSLDKFPFRLEREGKQGRFAMTQHSRSYNLRGWPSRLNSGPAVLAVNMTWNVPPKDNDKVALLASVQPAKLSRPQ